MRKAGITVAAAAATAMAALLMLLVAVGSDEPGATAGLPGVVCAPPGGAPGDPVAGFAGSQLAHAAAIVATGVEMGAPQRAHVIAVATAIQESQLYMYANSTVPESLSVPHERVGRDHDSVGLFQQRAGWGSVEVRMDPKSSARLFFDRLLALPNWESMPLTRAAQRVQISAFPNAYAKWEQAAAELVGSMSGIVCTSPDVLAANPQAQTVIDAAMSQLGVPYAWGGGNAQGPTRGISAQDSNVVGFDCSGLMVYAFAAVGVGVPHQTQAIWAAFQPAITDPGQVQPGDMILLSNNGSASGIHHIALYLGNGRVVHAPQSGSTVQVVEGIWSSPYWTREFIGAVRAMPNTPPPAARAA